MVKRWVVKTRKRASVLRKEPVPDSSKQNVIRLMKNGEVVSGDFVLVRRASREAGFVRASHIELQCGRSWRVQSPDGPGPILLRKQPHESQDATNTMGFASNGELVVGEYLYVNHKDERQGGYAKLCDLRPVNPRADAARPGRSPADSKAGGDASASSRSAPLQRWLVMDAGHDGAWLRRHPRSDNSKSNVVCLVPNGTRVAGEFVYVRRSSGQAGFLKFKDLREDGKVLQVHSAVGASSVPVWREPSEATDNGNVLCHAEQGEHVTAEYVFVVHGDRRRRQGCVRRRYLIALADPPKRLAHDDPGT